MAKKAKPAEVQPLAMSATPPPAAKPVEEEKIVSKFRAPVSVVRKIVKLLSMEGGDSGDASGKKSKSLFKEVIGIVGDKKFEGWTINDNGTVFAYLRQRIEELQKGEFWCGDMPRLQELMKRLGNDSSSSVVSCGNQISSKTDKGVRAWMSNVAHDQVGKRKTIGEYRELFTDSNPPTFGKGESMSTPTIEVIADAGELGEIVKDADIMKSEATVYPFAVKLDGKDEQGKDKHVFGVTSKDKSDGIDRPFTSAKVPVGAEVQSEYSIGVANTLRALSGMGEIKMFFSEKGVLFFVVDSFTTVGEVTTEDMHFVVMVSPRVDTENLEAGDNQNLAKEQEKQPEAPAGATEAPAEEAPAEEGQEEGNPEGEDDGNAEQ